jgi:hypothetical protein
MQEPVKDYRPDFADNEELKKAFGIALGQGLDVFNAGMNVFEQAVPKALWVSINWKNDPIVIAARDAYLKELKKAQKPLDREELLEEVLESAKIAPDFKDKATLFKLYSEIAGYIGIKAPELPVNQTNNTNNYTKIILVGGSQRETTSPEIINSNTKSEIPNKIPQLKLVGGTTR